VRQRECAAEESAVAPGLSFRPERSRPSASTQRRNLLLLPVCHSDRSTRALARVRSGGICCCSRFVIPTGALARQRECTAEESAVAPGLSFRPKRSRPSASAQRRNLLLLPVCHSDRSTCASARVRSGGICCCSYLDRSFRTPAVIPTGALVRQRECAAEESAVALTLIDHSNHPHHPPRCPDSPLRSLSASSSISLAHVTEFPRHPAIPDDRRQSSPPAAPETDSPPAPPCPPR
jgi:hypothetical protein